MLLVLASKTVDRNASRHAKTSQDGAMAVSSGKCNVMLVAEHGLYPPELASSDSWHDHMCMTMKGSYSRLSYNTNDGDSAAWNQYGGTGVTLTAVMRSRMAFKGLDPSKLGRWTWAKSIYLSLLSIQKQYRYGYSVEPTRPLLPGCKGD